MRKKIVILIMIIFLSGCTSQYTLEFSNDSIKEHAVINIPDSSIPTADSNGSIDDRVTPFIEGDQYPIYGEYEKKYDKKVNKKDNNTQVVLDYKFSHKEFKKSQVFKGCFTDSEFEEYDNSYLLSFKGSFYCLYGDEVEINIKTNNEVISNNADKVSGNTYTWVINKDNSLNANIKIEISKESRYIKYIRYAVIGIIIVGVVIAGLFIYKKYKESDSVNDI